MSKEIELVDLITSVSLIFNQDGKGGYTVKLDFKDNLSNDEKKAIIEFLNEMSEKI